MTPGASDITVSGTPVSLGSSVFIYSTKTIPYAPPLPTSQAVDPGVTTIASQVISPVPNGSGISIAGTTLTPGAPGIEVSGSSISLGSSALIVGTMTIPYQLPSNAALAGTTIAGQVVRPLPDGEGVAIADAVLTQGEGTVLSGTPVSFGSDAIVVGGSTFTLSLPTDVTGGEAGKPLVTTLGPQVLTADASAIAFNGTTISAGADALTVDGQEVSLGTSNDLIIGSSTVYLGAHDSDTDASSQISSASVNDFSSSSSLPTQLPSPSSLPPVGQTTKSGEATRKRTHTSGSGSLAMLYRFPTIMSINLKRSRASRMHLLVQ